jgi:hypothetical protein
LGQLRGHPEKLNSLKNQHLLGSFGFQLRSGPLRFDNARVRLDSMGSGLDYDDAWVRSWESVGSWVGSDAVARVRSDRRYRSGSFGFVGQCALAHDPGSGTLCRGQGASARAQSVLIAHGAFLKSGENGPTSLHNDRNSCQPILPRPSPHRPRPGRDLKSRRPIPPVPLRYPSPKRSGSRQLRKRERERERERERPA